MPRVLLVSKPLASPWNDGSKNLARDVSFGLVRHRATVFAPRDADLPEHLRRVALPAMAFSPGLGAKAGMALAMLGARADLWHAFFAPNAVTSAAACRLAQLRSVPTVHTMCSAPAEGVNVAPWLFADRTVVLSTSTRTRLLDEGVPADRIALIPPAAPAFDVRDAARRAAIRARLGLGAGPLWVFPGDFEHGDGATRMLGALATQTDAQLVMACRPKTAGASAARARLEAEAHALGVGDRVTFMGEIPDIHDLLATADVVSIPSSSMFAKTDLPLVLLESLRLGTPVVVDRHGPARELGDGEGGHAVEAGDAQALGTGLRAAIRGEVGRAAARTLGARYATDAMVARYEDLYEEVREARKR